MGRDRLPLTSDIVSHILYRKNFGPSNSGLFKMVVSDVMALWQSLTNIPLKNFNSIENKVKCLFNEVLILQKSSLKKRELLLAKKKDNWNCFFNVCINASRSATRVSPAFAGSVVYFSWQGHFIWNLTLGLTILLLPSVITIIISKLIGIIQVKTFQDKIVLLISKDLINVFGWCRSVLEMFTRALWNQLNIGSSETVSMSLSQADVKVLG